MLPPAEAAQPAAAPPAKRLRTESGLLQMGLPCQDVPSGSPADSQAGAEPPASAPQSASSSPQQLTAQPSRTSQPGQLLAPAAGAAGRPALASFACGAPQQPWGQEALQEQAQPQSQVPAWRQQNTLASLQLDAGRAAGMPASKGALQTGTLRAGQRPLAAFAATKGMQHSVPAANMALIPARPAQHAAGEPAGMPARAGSADPAHSRFAAFRLQPQQQQQQQQQPSAPEPRPHGTRKLMGRSALPSGLPVSLKVSSCARSCHGCMGMNWGQILNASAAAAQQAATNTTLIM